MNVNLIAWQYVNGLITYHVAYEILKENYGLNDEEIADVLE